MSESESEKFGEKRPDKPKQDQWGNDYRTFHLHLLKAEKKCTDDCKDHVTMTYSIEQDVVACDPHQAIILSITGQEVPTKRDWVPISRILTSYN